MNLTIDILTTELERLFSLDELTSMSERLLGLDPEDVGGATAKASFAKALAERCLDADRVDALVDVMVAWRQGVDPRVRDVAGLFGREELAPGDAFGPFVITRKLGESALAIVYAASRAGQDRVLKVLRHEATRDRRAAQRFLTANRMVAELDAAGLPEGLETGEIGGIYWTSHLAIDAQPLSARFARTGPAHFSELKAVLHGILHPLAALHQRRISHGDLKLENILVGRPAQGDDVDPRITLVDFGTDRLRQRSSGSNGHGVVLTMLGSPKTIAPEQVRGQRSEPATDVYAFGAVMYELLSGKPVFAYETVAEAALAHVGRAPEPPSAKAPRGWVSKDVDQFVLSLLAKEASRRPRDASAVLQALESLARASWAPRPIVADFPDETLASLIDLLLAAPDDADTAIALEKAIEEGADPARVANAFCDAAQAVPDLDEAEGEDREGVEIKKSLLYRAARILQATVQDREKAESVYAEILGLDPKDEIAQLTLDEVRKSLGKYSEVVESLIARSEAAAPGEERARLYAEIGRLFAAEIGDAEQAAEAFARALCETPMQGEYAEEIEHLTENKPELWREVLSALDQGSAAEGLSSTERNKLLLYKARWSAQRLGRPDVALHDLQQILASDPANDGAYETASDLYRSAQLWPELVAALVARAGASGSSPRARDARAEAAEVYEQKLSDPVRAKELFAQVLAEDPAHAKAVDGMARIAERTGDFRALVAVLERRAESRRGRDKADALLKVAEIYENRLEELPEATRRYEAVLATEPRDLQALKGLDRIYNRTGRHRELVENLETQVAIAATPRQKITLYERLAQLNDEEFLDHARAAECLQEVLAIDATNEAALSALPRLYRTLGDWEELEKVYERHANVVADGARRVDLLLVRARVLAENIGSPERAMHVYERVLELAPAHGGALEALARLREQAGDAAAAVAAIEALAAQAPTPSARAEQWVRAARLLEGRGDVDGAIDRYKLALEAEPTDAAAAMALRQAYAARGEAANVVALIHKELTLTDGKIAKARLRAELARVLHTNLHDPEEAEESARIAIDLDPTNSNALLVLGDIAFEGERYVEASKYLEPLVLRAGSLPPADAARVLTRFVDAYGKSVVERVSAVPAEGWRESSIPPPPQISVAEEHPRLAAAVEALERTLPDHAETLARIARVLFDCGDVPAARKVYERFVEGAAAELPAADYAEALWRYGEALRLDGELDRAVVVLRESADVDPSSLKPLRVLSRVYEQTGNWEELIRTKIRRLEVAKGDERFELLLQIGDIEFSKLNDRTRASETYVTALEERPDDRKLLTKLMQLYSEEKDWGNLIEVVLRLADFVDDPKQRAKYLHTAAIVSSRQLGEVEQAITFYERALEFDPTLTKAIDELVILRGQVGDSEGVERLLKTQLELAKEAQDRGKIVEILDQLGALYRTGLSEPELAIDAYEAAQAFEPDDKQRSEFLAELYASNVTQYLDKAVRAQAQILRRNPYRLDSYKLLRRLYTEARKPDSAWCICQALAVLNRADPKEESFYRRLRSDGAAPARAVLEDDDWTRRLAHPDADPLVTRVFAAIQPTIIRARTSPLGSLGYDESHQVDLTSQPYPVTQMLYYVQGVFGFDAPPVFQNQNDPGGLGFLHAHVPSIVLGRAAFEGDVPSQSLAFVAGRHMAYFRPGFYVRHLVPTGTGLKAWLFAAIKLCVPQFPIAPELEGQVDEAIELMTEDFHGVQREVLASIVSRLLQSGGAIDLKRWVTAIDLTADRAGFLLAYDLQATTDIMRATEDASSVAPKERIKEIVLFSISEDYLALRQKLGITIES
jgi:tetratricopeptide (TPR) repeat protein/tRNA A-37 threonylcarbamoyl transferase component Bud32